MIEGPLGRFLEEGLAIHIGARDERLSPVGARGVAVRVEPDGCHMVVYVAAIAASRLLPHLESNGQAAVSFARPVDHRACQVKGLFVASRQASGSERKGVLAQWQGFMRQLELVGIPPAGAAGWATWPAVAIRLKVTTIFEQTPGPGAGAPIA